MVAAIGAAAAIGGAAMSSSASKSAAKKQAASADAANQTESMGKADLRWRNLNSTTMDDGASCKFETKPVRSKFQKNARSAVSTLSVIAKSWFWIDRIRTRVLIDCRGQKRKAQRRVVESGRERGGGGGDSGV